jgi:hypothetical protein
MKNGRIGRIATPNRAIAHLDDYFLFDLVVVLILVVVLASSWSSIRGV